MILVSHVSLRAALAFTVLFGTLSTEVNFSVLFGTLSAEVNFSVLFGTLSAEVNFSWAAFFYCSRESKGRRSLSQPCV